MDSHTLHMIGHNPYSIPYTTTQQGAGGAGPVLSWDGWVSKANKMDLSWKVEVRCSLRFAGVFASSLWIGSTGGGWLGSPRCHFFLVHVNLTTAPSHSLPPLTNQVMDIFESFTERTPGSFLEIKVARQFHFF